MTTITQGSSSIHLETTYDISDHSGSICGSIYEWLTSKACASIDNVRSILVLKVSDTIIVQITAVIAVCTIKLPLLNTLLSVFNGCLDE